MNVVYRHKKTNATISREELMNYLKQGDLKICFNKSSLVSLLDSEYIVERYEYRISDIPFSSDFEIINVEDELEITEVEQLIMILKSGYEDETVKKILNKLFAKRKRLIEGSYK